MVNQIKMDLMKISFTAFTQFLKVLFYVWKNLETKEK